MLGQKLYANRISLYNIFMLYSNTCFFTKQKNSQSVAKHDSLNYRFILSKQDKSVIPEKTGETKLFWQNE